MYPVNRSSKWNDEYTHFFSEILADLWCLFAPVFVAAVIVCNTTPKNTETRNREMDEGLKALFGLLGPQRKYSFIASSALLAWNGLENEWGHLWCLMHAHLSSHIATFYILQTSTSMFLVVGTRSFRSFVMYMVGKNAHLSLRP